MNIQATGVRFAVAAHFAVCALILTSAASDAAAAQAFPTKPVRMVVPYPAGGAIDLSARKLAEDLTPELGQTVIIDNRGGANGAIGAGIVARSVPDGYTLLFTTLAAHAGNPAIYKDLGYDAVKDFEPVTVINSIPLLLVAHPSFPATTIPDLVKLAKEKPGTINYASFGTGGMAHLAGVQLELKGGIKMTHIPYKGGGPALADVIGGHVQLFFSGVNSALAHINNGRLRPIALSGTTRSRALPDVPTVAETPGFKDYEASVVPAVWAPARTPRDVINKLQSSIVKVIQTPKFRQRLERDGEGDPIGSTPEQMAAIVKKDLVRYAELIRAAGIKPE
jgi:tripartite-type tricarboxylate transporter receptor subunit TctC